MTIQGRVPFRRHHVSRRVSGPGSEAGFGVHIVIICGRFVVFVAGIISAGAAFLHNAIVTIYF